jgi:hypothetical protein
VAVRQESQIRRIQRLRIVHVKPIHQGLDIRAMPQPQHVADTIPFC